MCLEFHSNFVCFLIVEAGEKFFVAFGQKEGLRGLVLPPLKLFLCLGFMIIYHQTQVSHHEIAHEFNLHLHHPFIFNVFFGFRCNKDLLFSNNCKFCPQCSTTKLLVYYIYHTLGQQVSVIIIVLACTLLVTVMIILFVAISFINFCFHMHSLSFYF